MLEKNSMGSKRGMTTTAVPQMKGKSMSLTAPGVKEEYKSLLQKMYHTGFLPYIWKNGNIARSLSDVSIGGKIVFSIASTEVKFLCVVC